jgi:hypothetical protein
MKLTRYFSRIHADLPPFSKDGDGQFLHEEGMNLPTQKKKLFLEDKEIPSSEDEYSLENRSYSREETNELFKKYNMPDPVLLNGEEYYFTGKMGKSFQEQSRLAFEYSDYGEEVEKRLWMNTKGEVYPD